MHALCLQQSYTCLFCTLPAVMFIVARFDVRWRWPEWYNKDDQMDSQWHLTSNLATIHRIAFRNFDQWQPSKNKTDLCRPITGPEKCQDSRQTADRQTDRVGDIMKAFYWNLCSKTISFQGPKPSAWDLLLMDILCVCLCVSVIISSPVIGFYGSWGLSQFSKPVLEYKLGQSKVCGGCVH